jgi:hypothetical protein
MTDISKLSTIPSVTPEMQIPVWDNKNRQPRRASLQQVTDMATAGAAASAAEAAASAAETAAAVPSVHVADYPALRAYSGAAQSALITGSGIAGTFVRDATVTVDNGGTEIVGVHGWRRVFSGKVDVRWFGAKADLSADDYASIVAAASAAVGRGLIFPNPGASLGYKFGTPLVLSSLDVDFDGSNLFYTGAVGSFALTLISDAGAGSSVTCGNTFENFTLYQSDFSNYTTVSATVAYDAPSVAAGAALSNISPAGASTTVAVPGATVGGYARATLTTIQDGIVLTAWVSAPNVVTVWVSNYGAAAVDMAAGDLTVTVVNNAYSGLCLGGSLGKLRNAKTRGFTGVSLGLGEGRDPTSGINFPGVNRCYYWDIDANLTPSAGWGLIVPPRNNENSLAISQFAQNSYNEPVGARRANTINQVVLGGITNRFSRLSLEGTSSEATVVLHEGSNMCEGTGYIEYNTSFVTPGSPRVQAKLGSSSHRFSFRHPYSGGAFLSDKGMGNELLFLPAAAANGSQILAPAFSRNLAKNGNFLNGSNNWSDFSVGSVLSVTGAGVLSGKRARLDIVAGRPGLQQNIDTVNGIPIAGLVGQNITASCFIKSDIASVKPRLNGISSGLHSGGGSDEFLSVTAKIPAGTLSLPLIITTEASGLTGYVEISDVTVCLGTRPMLLGQEEDITGSATFNPASLAAGATQQTTVTVSGAVAGDYVTSVSHSQVHADVVWFGQVTAADTVTVTQWNRGAGAVDLGSGTLRVRVRKV